MISSPPTSNAFVSVIMVTRDRQQHLEKVITRASKLLHEITAHHEIIVVDNASNDDSLKVFRRLTTVGGIPNLQVFMLTREVDVDVAAWAGLENSLGDFVVVCDPFEDDLGALPAMLDTAAHGADVVFAKNLAEASDNRCYRLLRKPFLAAFKWITGIHLSNDSPFYRILSRRVVNFVLKHPAPTLSYRHIPATVGFEKANISYTATPQWPKRRNLMESVDRGMRILVSSSTVPLRLVTTLSMFGAAANLIYSIYVIAIAIFKTDVAPGWITLSLQQSGMFFLMSLVLLVIGEYLLQVSSFSNSSPAYHIAQEFTSPAKAWAERLNVEDGPSP